jgi:hypothetical protein
MTGAVENGGARQRLPSLWEDDALPALTTSPGLGKNRSPASSVQPMWPTCRCVKTPSSTVCRCSRDGRRAWASGSELRAAAQTTVDQDGRLRQAGEIAARRTQPAIARKELRPEARAFSSSTSGNALCERRNVCSASTRLSIAPTSPPGSAASALPAAVEPWRTSTVVRWSVPASRH